MSVRVRYAPSPTGLQHIGGARTALFNYLFARSRGGSFILRVEDTDRERYSEEALQDLYDTLDWLGISWDEGPAKGGDYGPYVQSERVEGHREAARRLVAEGKAYYCFWSAERLEQGRAEQTKAKKKVQGYDRRCRNLDPAEAQARVEAGEKAVIRFKVPEQGETAFEDIILGRVKRKNGDIPPDPILLKADGYPTYHLANVLDDHAMGITHILRAQEWIPSGPLHILLYQAFGWEPPVYCHLPMVMGKDGQKLSKRHGATAVRDFRSQGYLPEALVNYLALVGWSYDDSREFFTRQELEELFVLEKINKSPGVFDYKKLTWFNGQYIRQKSREEIRGLITPYLQEEGILGDPPTAEQTAILEGALPLIHERLKLLSDAPALVRFLFEEPAGYDPAVLIPKKMDAASTLPILRADRQILEGMDGMDDQQAEEDFRQKAEDLGVKLGQMLMPLRAALTGTTVSPPLIESIRVLGLGPSLERVDRAVGLLEGLEAKEQTYKKE